MGMGIGNSGIGRNGNGNRFLSWEWVGMGMILWEWEGMGTEIVLPAHLYLRLTQTIGLGLANFATLRQIAVTAVLAYAEFILRHSRTTNV